MTTPAVASGHPAVSEAAAGVLALGGNAFDAVVAAGFASAVAEPALSSLGGGGFLLARLHGGHAILFDFFVDTPGRGLGTAAPAPPLRPVTVRFPGSEQAFHVGEGSVAVPGVLGGYLHVHRRLGVLPLRTALAPAIALARRGVVVNEHQGYFLRLLQPIMTLTEAGRRLYAPAGRYLARGDVLRNAPLASFLETLPDGGAAAFYVGTIARAMAADMRAARGLLTEEDLARYRVLERTPLAVDYRGACVLTNPPPSFGGTLLALAFRMLNGVDLAGAGRGSAAHLGALVACMREVDGHREAGAGRSGLPSAAALSASVRRIRQVSRGTTHVSIVDAAGNVASMTVSNGECSGYVAPGTGIMLNNMMGEDDLHAGGFHGDPPGQRVASMMAPSVVLAGGRPRLVIGSGGSKRIRTALLQVVSNVLDFGLPIDAAVTAPRLHWDGACVQLEPGFAVAAVAALAAATPVNVWNVPDVYFGGVHAVAPGAGAAGDPRRGGDARAVRAVAPQ